MHVVLKKDGWYCKIQKFVFGADRSDFSSLCPFFWLTIFSCLASPFVLVGHGLKYLFMGIGWVIVKFLNRMEGTLNYIDNEYCQPVYDRQLSRFAEDLSDQDAYSLFYYMHGWRYWYDKEGIESEESRFGLGTTTQFYELKSKTKMRYIARFNRWKKLIGDAWTERIYAARKDVEAQESELMETMRRETETKYSLDEEKRKRKERKERIKEETKRKRIQMYNDIITYTRLLVWLPAGLVGLFVLYWLGRLGLVMYEHWTAISSATITFFSTLLSGIIFMIPWALGSVLLAAFLLGVGYILTKLITKCDLSFFSKVSIPGASKAKAVGSGMWSLTQKGLKPIGSVIETILKRLGSVGRVVMTVANTIVAAFKWVKKFFIKIGSFFKEVATFFIMYAKAVKTNYCPYIEWKEKV